MSHPRKVWLGFALALAVVAAAAGWLSYTALRLDRAQATAQRLAEREELVRLALWRMDAALTTVVAAESTRPYYQYQPFHVTTDAFLDADTRVRGRGVMVPSPLLKAASPLVRLHFQVDPAGQITSPQVPAGPTRKLAVPEYLSKEDLAQAAKRLRELQGFLVPGREQLLARLPEVPAAAFAATRPALLANANVAVRGRFYQGQMHGNELVARRQIGQRQHTAPGFLNFWTVPSGNVRDGEARSLWLGGRLLLARRVAVNKDTHVVGCWLDWPKMQDWLLENVRDLLPSAGLAALPGGPEAETSRRLATLPVRLVPGPVATEPMPGPSPIMVSLAAAWGGLVLAAGAVAVLLAGTLALSERRGAFVSAVTHELRTPLTTLRMYTEMLAEGMVPDERAAAQYLDTLHAETDRLCRLVENVLAYSHLESGRQPLHKQRLELGRLLAELAPRLGQRARRAGMELVVDSGDAPGGAVVLADATALEQILFNLIDNACKYAAGAEDKRIHVELHEAGRSAVLRVRDHGPGIPQTDAKKVFRPFFRAGRDAAGSLGGVGLGLTISRRLAHSLGGELTIDSKTPEGASFSVYLPVA